MFCLSNAIAMFCFYFECFAMKFHIGEKCNLQQFHRISEVATERVSCPRNSRFQNFCENWQLQGFHDCPDTLAKLRDGLAVLHKTLQKFIFC